MKNQAFLFGSILCLITLGVDGAMLLNGLSVLGVFSAIGTLLVFAAAFVWMVYENKGEVRVHRPQLIIPLVVFGVAMTSVFKAIPLSFMPAPENLAEVGNLLMSRYQIGLWIVSVIIFFMFIIATSLMTRRRT